MRTGPIADPVELGGAHASGWAGSLVGEGAGMSSAAVSGASDGSRNRRRGAVPVGRPVTVHGGQHRRSGTGTGPRSLGVRREDPVHAGRSGRRRSGSKMVGDLLLVEGLLLEQLE